MSFVLGVRDAAGLAQYMTRMEESSARVIVCCFSLWRGFWVGKI
jgi:hypothetical protein